jgi:hypothetical protein
MAALYRILNFLMENGQRRRRWLDLSPMVVGRFTGGYVGLHRLFLVAMCIQRSLL